MFAYFSSRLQKRIVGSEIHQGSLQRPRVGARPDLSAFTKRAHLRAAAAQTQTLFQDRNRSVSRMPIQRFFFTVVDQLRILRLGLVARFWFCFLGPIHQQFLTELSNLLDRSCFCFVSCASFSDGLINEISDHQQTPAQMWATGEALVEAWFVFAWVGMLQIIFHELLNYTQYLKVQVPICPTCRY